MREYSERRNKNDENNLSQQRLNARPTNNQLFFLLLFFSIWANLNINVNIGTYEYEFDLRIKRSFASIAVADSQLARLFF